MTEPNQNLKLLALDPEDLEIISAHCQDAIVKRDDISYLPGKRIFSMLINRFDWVNDASNSVRKRSVLHFKCVESAKHSKLRGGETGDILELLSLKFHETDKPAGELILIFAGGGEIKLCIECIEAELADIGGAWQAKSKPHHKMDE